MKHVLAYFFALVFLVTGAVLLWFNRTHPPTILVGAVIGCMLFAVMLAAPASGTAALTAIAPYLPGKAGAASALPQALAAPDVAVETGEKPL